MSDDKVLELHAKKADVNVVDHLKHLLELAEAGEIRFIAYAADTPTGIRMSWSGYVSNDNELLGAIERLKFLVLSELQEQSVKEEI